MNKEEVRIIRKRYIPNEEVILNGDEVLFYDDEKKIIVTKWLPIKKRTDISHGYSEYHLNDNYKVSVFFDENGKMLYIYADIVKYFMRDDIFVVVDLLLDVKKTDKEISVLDMDELVEARENGLITEEEYELSMRTCEKVVNILSEDTYFPSYIKDYIEK